jgi:DNA primase
MKFPPQFLEEIKNRVSISSVVGRAVSWDRRKSNPAKSEFWACCPFHGEKSPSFHVEDRKGFFKCFGCQESGDIFTFLVKKDGLSFPEAVERLAADAGLQMPVATPEERHKAQVRATLHQVIAMAADFYADALRQPGGAAARTYLNSRHITGAEIKSFAIGFAPAPRTALRAHLEARGVSVEQIVEAGLLVAGDGIPEPYDRFRDRIMFPIRDSRGRAVAFGGRAMSAEAKAKYLNSPETPIFHKGGGLYNYDRARPLAHQQNLLVVVEGYIDAIAVDRTGLPVVAPLGTALTADQLSLLWRAQPEPVLCFDGDAPGQKAAGRAMDLALPLLSPGHSLRFAVLPAGVDPDDFVRLKGAEAFRAVIQDAVPLIDMLWNRAMAANDRSSPERAAQFEKDLFIAVDAIADQTVRQHYRAALRERLRAMFEPQRTPFRRDGMKPNGLWRVGQPGSALLSKLAALEARTAYANQIREEGCSDVE